MENYEQSQVVEEKKVAERYKKSKLSIIVIIIGILTLLNSVLLIADFFIGGDVSASAQLRKIKNLNSYRQTVAEKCIEVNRLYITSEDIYTYADDPQYARGTVENISDEDLADISIKINCLDNSGEYISCEYVYIDFLAAGDKYSIDENIYADGVQKIEVGEMDAYYYSDIYEQANNLLNKH